MSPATRASRPLRLVGLSGNTHRPSKSRRLAHLLGARAQKSARAEIDYLDMVDIGPHVASALTPGDISAQGRTLLERIVSADGLIVSSPTYKGTYPGMFKHLFDLIDPEALIGRPVLLAATGGGARHALMVEHQLRPLFGFFSALTVPTSIYVSDADFADDAITERQIVGRIDLATRQFAEMLSMRRASPLAMTG